MPSESAPFGSSRVSAGMSTSTQWKKSTRGKRAGTETPSLFTLSGPEGTSGSWQMTAKDLILFGASLQRIAGLKFGPIVQWFRSSGTQNAYSSGIGSSYGQASITTFSSLLMSPPSLVSRHRCRAEAKAASRRQTEGNIFSQPDRFAAPSTKRSRLFLIARGVHICRVPIGGATSTLGNPGRRGRKLPNGKRPPTVAVAGATALQRRARRLLPVQAAAEDHDHRAAARDAAH